MQKVDLNLFAEIVEVLNFVNKMALKTPKTIFYFRKTKFSRLKVSLNKVLRFCKPKGSHHIRSKLDRKSKIFNRFFSTLKMF